jgi:sensor histidine kinase YesM
MKQVPFIFSDEPKYRWARHTIYWVFWWLFQGFLYSFTPAAVNYSDAVRFFSAYADSLIYMIGHILLSYALMYFLIPRFLLKQQYLLTVVVALIIFFIAAVLNAVLGQYFISPLHDKLGITVKNISFLQINYLTILAGLRGGITIAGISCAIKLMKYWYVKEQRNLQLQKENLESKLELLKSQVHPHFLFNTLNNLYSLTLVQSKQAPMVVTHLSDLLRYMLYECNEKTVPLNREVEALKKYVELEKLRYGNRIDVSFVCSGETGKLKIAPLLFLPFVENSFKHGVSHVLDQCWVNLHLHAGKDFISFNLSNSVAKNETNAGAGGIGLQNVKKRLDLLYPQQYELHISEEQEIFNVKLHIAISKQAEETIPESESMLVKIKPVPSI